MRIHLIDAGGGIMHDLAVALYRQGHSITGSHATFPTATEQGLARASLVTEQSDRAFPTLTTLPDQILVGPSVRPDHPELQAAQQRGLPIESYPAYLCHYAQDKQRIVVMGAEKKRICILALHVLAYCHKAVDYVVDAPQLDTTVRLSEAPVILLEGTTAPSSPTDKQLQCLRYQHHVAVLSSTGEDGEQSLAPAGEPKILTALADASPKSGMLIYNEEDPVVRPIGSAERIDVKRVPYRAHPYRHKDGTTHLITPQGDVPLHHVAYLEAVAGAQQLLRNMAITDQQFYEALCTFSNTE